MVKFGAKNVASTFIDTVNINELLGSDQLIFDRLKDVPNMNIYRKAKVPPEYHYSNADGIMPLQMEAKIHYRFSETDKQDEAMNGVKMQVRGRDRKYAANSTSK